MDVVMELLQNTMYVSGCNTQSIQCNRAEGAKCACTGGKRNPAAITCVASVPKLPFYLCLDMAICAGHTPSGPGESDFQEKVMVSPCMHSTSYEVFSSPSC